MAQNQADEALRTINEAIAEIPDHGESFDMPEMLRVKGDILARSGNAAEAESCFRNRSICRAGNARSAGSCGGPSASAGSGARPEKPADARALLAPLVARYQEGLQTRDLVAARELLSALN